jgi:hypothetical protein
MDTVAVDYAHFKIAAFGAIEMGNQLPVMRRTLSICPV